MKNTLHWPNGARKSEDDSVALTRTTWDQAGVQTGQRGLLQAEIDAFAPLQSHENAASLQAKAKAAIALNNTYLALASPTAAQTTQQVIRLSRECNAIIRLLIGLTDTDDA